MANQGSSGWIRRGFGFRSRRDIAQLHAATVDLLAALEAVPTAEFDNPASAGKHSGLVSASLHEVAHFRVRHSTAWGWLCTVSRLALHDDGPDRALLDTVNALGVNAEESYATWATAVASRDLAAIAAVPTTTFTRDSQRAVAAIHLPVIRAHAAMAASLACLDTVDFQILESTDLRAFILDVQSRSSPDGALRALAESPPDWLPTVDRLLAFSPAVQDYCLTLSRSDEVRVQMEPNGPAFRVDEFVVELLVAVVTEKLSQLGFRTVADRDFGASMELLIRRGSEAAGRDLDVVRVNEAGRPGLIAT